MLPEANLALRNVGLNPTRAAVLDFLVQMGARVRITSLGEESGELVGDLHVSASRKLPGGAIEGKMVAAMIDELPALAVLGTATEQGIEIRDAQELRVKESDRIALLASNLRRMGASVEERPDGLKVPGKQRLRGAEIDPQGDHRIAMAFAVAGLAADSPTTILGSDCVEVSFPGFFEILGNVTERE
jgi:3-phosphoshikimate 1-carboxyvinyltransferase